MREKGVLGVSIEIFCDHFLQFHFYVFSFLLHVRTFSIESVIFLFVHYQHFCVLGSCVNFLYCDLIYSYLHIKVGMSDNVFCSNFRP